MLYPPGSDKRVGYSRVSTLAKALDDKSGLVNWKASMAIMGLMKSKPLQARTAALVAKGGGYAANKKPLAEIVDRATDLAGSSNASNNGTSVHEFTEVMDAGDLDWDLVPNELKGPLDAYGAATERLKVLDTEVFVSVDADIRGKPLRTAGSMDRIWELDGVPVVGDLKTGANEPKYPFGVTTQVAIYSRGMRYRDDTFDGSPAFTDGVKIGGAYRKPLSPGLSMERGLMVHLPLEKVGGKYVCDLYVLDLVHGWEAAELSLLSREVKKVPKLEKL